MHLKIEVGSFELKFDVGARTPKVSLPKMDNPDLNTAGLDLGDEDMARERTRVKSGTLRKLARIVLFSPDIPHEEDKHWSIQPISNLKFSPIDLLPDVRLPDEAWLERRKLVYKSSGGGAWESMIFCRVEDG